MEFLSTVNWETIGVTVLGIISTLIGIYAWLKKNLANIKQLQADSADLSVQVKYYKAMIKGSKDLRNEISDSKLATNNMLREFKVSNERKDKMIDNLKSELTELKSDVRNLINVIKEKEDL
jgi:hypothetical protein